MIKPALHVALIAIGVSLLSGCAFVDKHLFNPAASHARVDPLFRTAECKDYKAPNGGHWLATLMGDGKSGSASTRNMSSVFVQDGCDFQTRSINDVDGSEEEDVLYAKICKPELVAATAGAANCLNYLISKSDEICGIHKSHIYGNRTAMDTTLGILATGAGVAGAMSGVGAAQALAGSAGFLTGSQSLMNEEVYKNYVTEAILLEIDSNRKKFLETIGYLANGQGAGTTADQIGIGRVRRDALIYHEKCSFYDGLVSLLNKAGDKVEKGNAALDKLIGKKQGLEKKISDLEKEIAEITGNSSTDLAKKGHKNSEKKGLERQLATVNEIISNFVVPKSLGGVNSGAGS